MNYDSLAVLASAASIPADTALASNAASIWAWLALLLVIAAAVAAHEFAYALLHRLAERTEGDLDNLLLRIARRPTQLILVLLLVQMVLPSLQIASDQQPLVRHMMALATIITIIWLLIAGVRLLAALIKRRHDINVADNYAARRVHTQINVLSRVVMIFIIVIGVGLALMTFPRVRELGTSLLASAGIAGLIIGFAARPLLENLIAGVQLALTQPINMDDVVIIEGEWGRIEQITTTYVVVRIWDERRLIVPFSKFISEPFQNWTRRTADILGTVFIYADYTVPVQQVREALRTIVEQSPDWDGRVCVLQVTGATDRAVELRALVSAGTSSKAWELRVFVREKLVEFLQREYPHALPRTRVAIKPDHPPTRDLRTHDAGGSVNADPENSDETTSEDEE